MARQFLVSGACDENSITRSLLFFYNSSIAGTRSPYILDRAWLSVRILFWVQRAGAVVIPKALRETISTWSCVQPGSAVHTLAGVFDRLRPRPKWRKSLIHGINSEPTVVEAFFAIRSSVSPHKRYIIHSVPKQRMHLYRCKNFRPFATLWTT